MNVFVFFPNKNESEALPIIPYKSLGVSLTRQKQPTNHSAAIPPQSYSNLEN